MKMSSIDYRFSNSKGQMRPRDFSRLIDQSGVYPRLIVSAIEVPATPKQFNGAEYVGNDRVYSYVDKRFHVLKGKTAIIIYGLDGPHHCRAQFDDLSLPESYTHGWKKFPVTDWFIHVSNFN